MRFGSLGSPEELGLLDERTALLDVLPLRDDEDGLILSESTVYRKQYVVVSSSEITAERLAGVQNSKTSYHLGWHQ